MMSQCFLRSILRRSTSKFIQIVALPLEFLLISVNLLVLVCGLIFASLQLITDQSAGSQA